MTPSKWRYIEDDGSPAGFGLAADEYIAKKLCASPYSHIIRLYTYKGPCVMVGRFQDVDSEVNLSRCRELPGVEINRRPTGGGAIVMGEGQLGVAIAGPMKEKDRSPLLASKAVLSPFTRGIIAAFGLMCLQAWFRPENDICIRDKKIAGLASCCLDEGTAVLYHASILADMDTGLMLDLLKKPGEKPGNKKGGAITTVSSELGRHVSTDELRDYVKRGIEKTLHAEFIPEPLTEKELAEVKNLEQKKYSNTDWIYHGKEHPTQNSRKQLEIAAGLRPSQ
ncbi:MAG: lipoate--protein ligase family protein [Candidatus Brocadiales bacterium]|nr:lipoate--protein ligase family protein [Candidatus Bathyanammoxibius amoris]